MPAPIPPNYLFVLTDGSRGAYTVSAPTTDDFAFARAGFVDIIRLSDLARFDDDKWVPVPAGMETTAEIEGEINLPFHVHPDRCTPATGARAPANVAQLQPA